MEAYTLAPLVDADPPEAERFLLAGDLERCGSRSRLISTMGKMDRCWPSL
jgi:hypothetical protein